MIKNEMFWTIYCLVLTVVVYSSYKFVHWLLAFILFLIGYIYLVNKIVQNHFETENKLLVYGAFALPAYSLRLILSGLTIPGGIMFIFSAIFLLIMIKKRDSDTNVQ